MNKKLRKIRFENLFMFHLLTQNESFSETGKVLGKTQGTVSQQLADLEELFGDITLIERGPQEFKITDEGKKFQQFVSKILGEINNLSQTFTKMKGKDKIKIKISTSSIPGKFIIPEIIMDFQKNHPKIDLDIQTSNTRQSIELVKEEKVQFSIVGGFLDFDSRLFDFQKIGFDIINIIARKKHPIFNFDQKEVLKELFKYNWIFREEGSATRNSFFKNFPNAEKFNIGLELQNDVAIMIAVEHSDALTALSSKVYNSVNCGKNLKIIDFSTIPEIKRNFYILKLKNKRLTDSERDFWNCLN